MSGSVGLTSEEFLNVYDASALRWEAQYNNVPWYHMSWFPVQVICQVANAMIASPYYESIVC